MRPAIPRSLDASVAVLMFLLLGLIAIALMSFQMAPYPPWIEPVMSGASGLAVLLLTIELVLVERRRDDEDTARFEVAEARVYSVDELGPEDTAALVFDVINKGHHDSALHTATITTQKGVSVELRRLRRYTREEHWNVSTQQDAKSYSAMKWVNEFLVRSGERITFAGDFNLIDLEDEVPSTIRVQPVLGRTSGSTIIEFVTEEDAPFAER